MPQSVPLHHDRDASTWRCIAYVTALAWAATIGYFLLHVPFDVSDNVIPLTMLQGSSLKTLFLQTATLSGFTRPGGWATSKIIFESSGNPYLAFRIVNVATIAGVMLLVVRLLRIDVAERWAAALLCLVAIVGIHTFHDAVRETPLNHHLIVPLLLLAVVVLSTGTPRWWRDALVIALVAYAALLVELGLLAWLCVVGAYVLGWRGITWRAVLACTAVIAVYFVLRFSLLNVGAPGLSERSSGFGLRVLDPPELQARFGANPLPFYAYNVAAAGFSVLFSEPRAGVFRLVSQLLAGDVAVGTAINVVTSTTTTAVMIYFAASRWHQWIRRKFSDDDRLFLLAVAVLAGNAIISFPYLKDVVMNTGATFYALAMFPCVVALLAKLEQPAIPAARAGGIAALLLVLSLGWTVRGALFFVDLRASAYKFQNSWESVYDWLATQNNPPLTPSQRALVDRLRAEFSDKRIPRAYLDPDWMRPLDAH
jgi:hypothetical protein